MGTLLAAGMLLITGCNATKSPQKLEADTRATRDASAYAKRDWKKFLEPESDAAYFGPFVVDGRELVLQVRYSTNFEIGPQGHRNARVIYHEGFHTTTEGPYYAVLDAATKEAVLPLDWNMVVVVPGQAIYVHTAEQLKKRGDFFGCYTLDVHSGKLNRSSVVSAATYQPVEGRVTPDFYRPERWIPSDPTVWPALLQERGSDANKKLPTVTVVPPVDTGLASTRLENVKDSGLANLRLKYLGGLMRFTRENGEGGTTTALFNADGSLWLETDRETKVFTEGFPGKVAVGQPRRVLATPAPGTSPLDDLWHLLGDNGEFGAPEGVIGYRPVTHMWSIDYGAISDFERWLVRRDSETVGGSPWMMADANFKPIPGAEYLDVRLVDGPWFEPPSNKSDTANNYNQEVMAVQFAPNLWELYRPGIPTSKNDTGRKPIVASDSYEGLMAALATHVAEREVAYRKWEAARLAQLEKERREKLDRDWRWALDNKSWNTAESLAAQRGGGSYYELVNALGDPTLEFLDRAIAATSDARLKQSLQARRPAVQQRYYNDLAAAAAELKERERQRYVASQPTWSSSSSSYSSSSSSDSLSSWSVSAEQKRSFRAAASFSTHSVNMGWRQPYDWR